MGDVGVARISQRVHNVVKISVPLDRVGLKIVSNTHVYCELTRYLPIVLNVRRKSDVAKIAVPICFSISRTREEPGNAVQERLQARERVVSIPVRVAERIDLLPSKTRPDFH